MDATHVRTHLPSSGSGARRKFLSLAGLLVVLATAGGSGVFASNAAGAHAPTAPDGAVGNTPAADKIAPDLLGQFYQAGQGAKLQYWVILADQADTRNTIPNSRWADKGWYVYNLLT